MKTKEETTPEVQQEVQPEVQKLKVELKAFWEDKNLGKRWTRIRKVRKCCFYENYR